MTQRRSSVEPRRRFVARAFAATALGAAVLIAFRSPASAEPVKIKSFRPPAYVQRSNLPNKWFPIHAGQRLDKGDVLKTGKKAQVELVMTDGSKMLLRAESQMAIKETGADRIFGLDFGRLKSFIN